MELRTLPVRPTLVGKHQLISRKKLILGSCLDVWTLKKLFGPKEEGSVEKTSIFWHVATSLRLDSTTNMEQAMELEACSACMKDQLESTVDAPYNLKKECVSQTSLVTTKTVNSASESRMSSWLSSTRNTRTGSCLRTSRSLLTPVTCST